jgi:hypothetical protein
MLHPYLILLFILSLVQLSKSDCNRNEMCREATRRKQISQKLCSDDDGCFTSVETMIVDCTDETFYFKYNCLPRDCFEVIGKTGYMYL